MLQTDFGQSECQKARFYSSSTLNFIAITSSRNEEDLQMLLYTILMKMEDLIATIIRRLQRLMYQLVDVYLSFRDHPLSSTG